MQAEKGALIKLKREFMRAELTETGVVRKKGCEPCKLKREFMRAELTESVQLDRGAIYHTLRH